MVLSNQELADIVLIYGEAQCNGAEARRLYAARYPNRILPGRSTFQNTVQHLRDYGSFRPQVHDRGRDRFHHIVIMGEHILNNVAARPNTSTCRLSFQYGVAHSTVWRIVKAQQLYPYHIQRVQFLKPEDPACRRNFCAWLIEKTNRQPSFSSYLLATDEAGFTREGVFNVHNTHVWADENPHATRKHNFQEEFSINVWAGILNGQLIGPHILPARLNAEQYLRFYERFFLICLTMFLLKLEQGCGTCMMALRAITLT